MYGLSIDVRLRIAYLIKSGSHTIHHFLAQRTKIYVCRSVNDAHALISWMARIVIMTRPYLPMTETVTIRKARYFRTCLTWLRLLEWYMVAKTNQLLLEWEQTYSNLIPSRAQGNPIWLGQGASEASNVCFLLYLTWQAVSPRRKPEGLESTLSR